MEELIKVTQNENGQRIISGRELHEGLKVQQDFSDWIKKQLDNVDAEENVDFTRFPFKREGNNATLIEYALTIDIAKEICMVVGISPRTNNETKRLSKTYRKYLIECEKQLMEKKDSYMISDPVERALRWIEEEKERQRLSEENKKLTDEVIHKEDVIVGLVEKIDLADMRQILNRVVRYNGAKYSERWNELYKQFEMKYHINLKRRYDTYNENNKPKMKSKLDYIDKVMGKLPELYEIACKLYENDVNTLVQEMYELNNINTNEIKLIK